MSSYGWLFELRRPEGFNLGPLYAHNAYLNFLGDFGLVGVLFILPMFWMIFQAVRTHNAQPRYVLLEHPKRRKVVPNKRMFLCAVLMAFFAFALQLFFEFNLRIPALLFITSIYLAIMIKCLPTQVFNFKAGLINRLVCVGVAVFVSISMLTVASQYLLGQSYAYETERLLDQTTQQVQERQTLDPVMVEDALALGKEAIECDANNPRLQTDLARAILTQNFLHPGSHKEYGLLAEEEVRQALEISPKYMLGWITLGTALWMQGDYQASTEAYRRATEIAPNNPAGWYYLAAALNLDTSTRSEALTAVDRSLSLDPDNEQAQSLRMKILIP